MTTKTLKGGESCVPCIVLSAHRAEMRKLTALWRARAGAACRRLGEQRPHSACNETKQSREGNSACKPPQTKDQAASCLPVMLHLPLQWPFFFFFPILWTTSKGCNILQFGQQPCGTQCKHIHLFIHLSNIYQKLSICLVLAKCLGCSDKWGMFSTREPSYLQYHKVERASGGGSGDVNTCPCTSDMHVHFKPAKTSFHKYVNANNNLFN